MKCFKRCFATTDELRPRKSNVLDAFDDVESLTLDIQYDRKEKETYRVAAKDSPNHNGDYCRPYYDVVWLRSCRKEVIEPLTGEITGRIPEWLTGTLLKNGPGNLKVGEHTFQHVFDSSALMHRFRIENGEVTYQRRFVQSDTYRKNKVAQRIVVTEFGTKATPDPCQSIFHRVSAIFHRNDPNQTDNTMISVYPFGDEYYTLTEAPVMHRIDPTTLQTINKLKLTDYINIVHHTAHPHVMSDGTVYNIGLSITQKGPQYNVVCFYPRRVITDKSGKEKELSMFDQATFVASIPCRWKLNPSYMHSFGITDNYFVIVEQPLTFSTTKMVISRATREPVIDCLKWYKNKNTLIHIISRDSGRLMRTFISETFFFFHIINQFETRDGQYVVLDLCCYRDAKSLERLYVESIKDADKMSDYEKLFGGKPLRFVLPMKQPRTGTPPDLNLITIETVHQSLAEQLSTPSVVEHNDANCEIATDFNVGCKSSLQKKPSAHRLPDGNVFVKPELLCDLHCEIPRINYGCHLGKEYRFFYAVSCDVAPNTSCNSQIISPAIIKVDTFRKTVETWQEENVYVGEPVFVARPNGKNEDDGVVLSSLIWMKKHENRIGLLILDAATFTEIARATFDTPGSAPKGLHGWFTLDK